MSPRCCINSMMIRQLTKLRHSIWGVFAMKTNHFDMDKSPSNVVLFTSRIRNEVASNLARVHACCQSLGHLLIFKSATLSVFIFHSELRTPFLGAEQGRGAEQASAGRGDKLQDPHRQGTCHSCRRAFGPSAKSATVTMWRFADPPISSL